MGTPQGPHRGWGPPGPPPQPYGRAGYGPPPVAAGYHPTGPGAPRYANWLERAGATLIDGVLQLLMLAPFAAGGFVYDFGTDCHVRGDGMPACGGGSSPGLQTAGTVLMIAGIALSLAFWLWNRCVRQGRGRSIGKSALGLTVVTSREGRPIGTWRSIWRELAHLLNDWSCWLGYLWALWDDRRQTWSDKVSGAVVIKNLLDEKGVNRDTRAAG